MLFRHGRTGAGNAKTGKEIYVPMGISTAPRPQEMPCMREHYAQAREEADEDT